MKIDFDFTENEALNKTDVSRSAVISSCGNYRYSLERKWDETKPKVMFLMLNPSTADANTDDATIRRCIGFAKSWGYGSLCVGNLFAYRSTNPKELLNVSEPIGMENKWYLDLMANVSKTIICAWGNAPIVNKLGKKFGENWKPLKGIDNLHYIDLSNDGTPKHPLYLKSELVPKKYEVVACRVCV